MATGGFNRLGLGGVSAPVCWPCGMPLAARKILVSVVIDCGGEYNDGAAIAYPGEDSSYDVTRSFATTFGENWECVLFSNPIAYSHNGLKTLALQYKVGLVGRPLLPSELGIINIMCKTEDPHSGLARKFGRWNSCRILKK